MSRAQDMVPRGPSPVIRGPLSEPSNFRRNFDHAWVGVPDGVAGIRSTAEHHEVGASLSLGYLLPVRIDVTQRLDEPGTFVGFGIARLF